MSSNHSVTVPTISHIAANFETVRERISRAAEESDRLPDDVTLIAVTKNVPIERIREAIGAGVRHFGENRVQEALAKFAAPMCGGREVGEARGEKVQRAGISLHMIGRLQRNKAYAARLFDVVHSVDRIELVEALERAFGGNVASPGRDIHVALPVLIEVNVTGEESKSGVAPEGLSRLAESLGRCNHLRGVGLMTVGRMGASEAEARRTFAQLRELLATLRCSYPGDWSELSMGMSDDYVHAIREGATMVRLGRAIFGERTQR